MLHDKSFIVVLEDDSTYRDHFMIKSFAVAASL
jgi:hypothetical protein